MTTRERNLLIFVGVVMLGGLAYNFGFKMPDSSNQDQDQSIRIDEAYRLIRSQHNIVAHHQVIQTRLTDLQNKFYSVGDIQGAQISLLNLVEQIAYSTQLDVQQKNMIRFTDNLIGVAIEGKTNPESLIKFLQRTTEAKIGMKIQRMQIHVLPESKSLNYQITLSSLLVKRNGN